MRRIGPPVQRTTRPPNGLPTLTGVINPRRGATIYEQVAERVRRQIISGVLRPGALVSSERTLAQELGVGRQTVNHAMPLLRDEGLLEHRRGRGLYVREQPTLSDLVPEPGSVGIVRMPTVQEQVELELPGGVPVIEVTGPDGEIARYPGDRWRVRWSGR